MKSTGQKVSIFPYISWHIIRNRIAKVEVQNICTWEHQNSIISKCLSMNIRCFAKYIGFTLIAVLHFILSFKRIYVLVCFPTLSCFFSPQRKVIVKLEWCFTGRTTLWLKNKILKKDEFCYQDVQTVVCTKFKSQNFNSICTFCNGVYKAGIL